MIVHTEHLTKTFGRVEAVRNLDLDIPDGSVFALTGPNGAGKTTAIKTILNIIRPTSGRAQVLGADSRALGPPQLAQIGYLSENQQLPEWMPVGYFLNYCREFYPAWNEADATALIRAYALPLDRPLKNLSRGMRMNSALVSALAFRPRLLVLDEPFGGLDVLVREQLIEGILERTPECTVLLASHDLAEIESFASHVAYVDEGRLRFTEEMGALWQRFREIEVTLTEPADLPRDWPASWLNPEQSSVVVRFTDSRYDPERTEAEIRHRFHDVREITARSIPLRSIFVALAKSTRSQVSRPL